MAVKELPVKGADYYKLMKKDFKIKLEELILLRANLKNKINSLRDDVCFNSQKLKKLYNIDVFEYKEFVDKQYIDGSFFHDARTLVMNKKDNYELSSELYDVYKLAKAIKDVHDYNNKIKIYQKCITLTFSDYSKYIRTYFNEVHKNIIVEGNAYGLSNRIGWIFINRVKNTCGKKVLDFKATRTNKERLLKEGKKLLNMKDYNWCKEHSVPYDGVDYRVYRVNEYFYEIAHIYCTLTNATKLRLDPVDYRGVKLRGKSNDQLIEECNYDLNKICELPMDCRSKLLICDSVDKTLYTKFIRDDSQKSIANLKIDWKNR